MIESGRVGRELRPDALVHFLSWEYVPAPNTLIRAISKLEPGHLLDVPLDSLKPISECDFANIYLNAADALGLAALPQRGRGLALADSLGQCHAGIRARSSEPGHRHPPHA